MGDVVDFKKDTKNIKYDNFFKYDPYLRASAFSALQIAGYTATKEGLMQFEADNGFEVDGVLSTDHLPILLSYIEPQTRQIILNHIEERNNAVKNSKASSGILLILTLGLMCFFELYGVISCFLDILHFFK